MAFSQGDHLSLSSVTSTLHIGSHADAPSHYHREGKGIDQSSLSTYLGHCQVIDVSHISGEINLEKMGKPFEIASERVLFKTKSIQNVCVWQDDFSYMSPELVYFLAGKGVKLIGIDTPSMDFSKSKELEAHQAFHQTKVSILEGLVLDDIHPGFYILIALPLKIQGAEASPVRAVLLDESLSILR